MELSELVMGASCAVAVILCVYIPNMDLGIVVTHAFQRLYSTEFKLFLHPRHPLMKSYLQVLNMIISIMIDCWGVTASRLR